MAMISTPSNDMAMCGACAKHMQASVILIDIFDTLHERIENERICDAQWLALTCGVNSSSHLRHFSECTSE